MQVYNDELYHFGIKGMIGALTLTGLVSAKIK